MAEGGKQVSVDLCNIKANTKADFSHTHQTRNLHFDLTLSVKL